MSRMPLDLAPIVERAINDEIGQIIAEEVAKLAPKIEDRLREAIGKTAVKCASMVNMRLDQRALVIKIVDTRPAPAK